MRLLPLALMILFIFVVIAVVRPAAASGLPGPNVHADALLAATPPRPVSQHDDSRVGVQLVVAGIAAGLVVGVGTGAYLLRRKLGLTAQCRPRRAEADTTDSRMTPSAHAGPLGTAATVRCRDAYC